MGLLDKLLGRTKKVASEAQEMGERAYERSKDVVDRDKEEAAPGGTTESGAGTSTMPSAPTEGSGQSGGGGGTS